jgi:hypothetical protein
VLSSEAKLLHQPWNNGIVEGWNIGFSIGFYLFLSFSKEKICRLPIISIFSDPLFQYSSIPVGAKPPAC